MKIGELLVSKNIITRDQLRNAMIHQAQTGFKMGRVLVDLNYCNWKQIAIALSEQFNLPYIDLSDRKISPSILFVVSLELMKRYEFVAFEYRKPLSGRPLLYIATANPYNMLKFDEVSIQTNCELKVYLGEEDILQDKLSQLSNIPPLVFDNTYTVENIAKQILALNASVGYLSPQKESALFEQYTHDRNSGQKKIPLDKWPIPTADDIMRMASECFDEEEISLLKSKSQITASYELEGLANFKIILCNRSSLPHYESPQFNLNSLEMTIIRLGPGLK